MQNSGQLNISTLCQKNFILLKTQQVFMFNFWKFVILSTSPHHLTHKWWSPYVVQKIKIAIIEDKYKNAHLCHLQAGRLGSIARSQMLNRRQWVNLIVVIILYLVFTTITTPTIVLVTVSLLSCINLLTPNFSDLLDPAGRLQDPHQRPPHLHHRRPVASEHLWTFHHLQFKNFLHSIFRAMWLWMN